MALNATIAAKILRLLSRIKIQWLECFINKAIIGGPAATPMNLIELYMEVMVPRSSFSTPSVIKASRQGSPIPIPTPLIKNIESIYHRLVENQSAAMETAAATIPPNVNHFINTLFFLITLPLIKEDKQSAPSGNAKKNPFLIFLIPYLVSNISER